MCNGKTANLGEMLLDTQKDPFELKNLASDPEYAKIVAR